MMKRINLLMILAMIGSVSFFVLANTPLEEKNRDTVFCLTSSAEEKNWWDVDHWLGGIWNEIESNVFYSPISWKEVQLDSIYVQGTTSGSYSKYSPYFHCEIDHSGNKTVILKGYCKPSSPLPATEYDYVRLPEKVEWESVEYIITSIEGNLLDSCEKIELPSTIRQINSNTFSKMYHDFVQVGIDGYESFTNRSERGFKSPVEYLFNEGLETIFDYCFNGIEVEGLSFPSSLQYIGSEVGSNNSKLQSVEFNEGLRAIGPESFSNCPLLKEVTLPSTLQTLGKNSFNNCEGIEKVNLSRWIRNVGGFKGIFNGCPNIKEIVYPSNTPISAYGCFDKVNKEECILYVPYKRGYYFAQVEGWKEFKNIVELPLHPDALDQNGNRINVSGVAELPVETPESDEYYVTLDGIRYNEWNDIPHATVIIYHNQKIIKP